MIENNVQIFRISLSVINLIDEKKMNYDRIRNKAAEIMPSALKGLSIQARQYNGAIDKKLAPWHLYLSDAGHSVMAILLQHENIAFQSAPSQYLIPIPVKSVMRSYSEDAFTAVNAFDQSYRQRLMSQDVDETYYTKCEEVDSCNVFAELLIGSLPDQRSDEDDFEYAMRIPTDVKSRVCFISGSLV